MLTTPTAEQAAQRITEALEQWKALVWAVARELNCLPSTFPDGNAHVLKAAIALNAERAEWSDRTAEAQAERDAAREERDEMAKDAARLRAKLDALDNLPAEDFIRKVAQQMGPPPFDTWPVSHVCQQNADEALELVSEYDRLAALTTKDTQ